MDDKTGGELLADQLTAEGVQVVFGVPGIQLDYAVDGLAQHTDTIRYVSTRHEQGAAYMADGYSRVAGRPGVCMVVPGPGLLNAGAALATAFACNSRVVCIVGQIPSATIGMGYGMLHEVSGQSELLASLTKWNALVRAPADIPRVVNEAFRQVLSGRPRPVGIEIPPDILKSVSSGRVVAPAVGEAVVPDERAVGRAIDVLRTAERPVIYAGGGACTDEASAELRGVAEALGAPVVMSRNGRGAISDRHPLALTRLAGTRVLAEADAVLAVGTRFMTQSGRPVVYGAKTAIVAVNADPMDTRSPREIEVAIISDVTLGLRALRAGLKGKRPQPDLSAIRKWTDKKLESIRPQVSWLNAIRRALPDDGILVDELTQVGYPSRLAYPVYKAGTYITPGYQGTLGYGFPTGLGAKIARPDTPVVAISGDGGFGWNVQELSTAAKYGVGLVTVVFTNGAFGNVKRIQEQTFGRTLGVDLEATDYGKLAEAFGVDFVRSETPEALTSAIQDRMSAPEPTLIQVPVGDMPSPWDLIAEPSFGAEEAGTDDRIGRTR